MTTTKLYALKQVTEVFGWPYSSWATGHLIRQGKLGCVRVGRKIFVTVELLQAFIAKHTVTA